MVWVVHHNISLNREHVHQNSLFKNQLRFVWIRSVSFIVQSYAICRKVILARNSVKYRNMVWLWIFNCKLKTYFEILGAAGVTRKANELVVTTYRPLEIYTFLILEYLILILIVSFLVRRLEKKMKKDS